VGKGEGLHKKCSAKEVKGIYYAPEGASSKLVLCEGSLYGEKKKRGRNGHQWGGVHNGFTKGAKNLQATGALGLSGRRGVFGERETHPSSKTVRRTGAQTGKPREGATLLRPIRKGREALMMEGSG